MISIDLINAVLVAEYFIKYVFKLYRLLNLIIWLLKSDFTPVCGDSYKPRSFI
jgi:hypothetical protein